MNRSRINRTVLALAFLLFAGCAEEAERPIPRVDWSSVNLSIDQQLTDERYRLPNPYTSHLAVLNDLSEERRSIKIYDADEGSFDFEASRLILGFHDFPADGAVYSFADTQSVSIIVRPDTGCWFFCDVFGSYDGTAVVHSTDEFVKVSLQDVRAQLYHYDATTVVEDPANSLTINGTIEWARSCEEAVYCNDKKP